MARSAKVKPSPPARLSWIDAWLPFVLGAAAFIIYLPSIFSGFVYDGRVEILEEGYITSLSNLPDVLTLRVLSSTLMLGDRPGHLLYLMMVSAIWGKQAWGFHLCSNILHAVNVALLYIVLRRLVMAEWPLAVANHSARVRLVLMMATLIFAVHPLSVETVAEVNYSSDLLITLFTMLALFAAIHFRPGDRRALSLGVAGTLCALAAVTCKESGLAAAVMLIGYWFLYRRPEAKTAWLIFLTAAMTVTLAFLAVRFAVASPELKKIPYLGGSLGAVFLIQPRLWIFMFCKLVWPTGFSADYTIENVHGLPLLIALPVLLLVLGMQGWLASRSKLGAFGVLLFWIGLATVSNFVPLHRIVADRFYYLPLAGVAMQLVAWPMTVSSEIAFRSILTALFVATVPLTFLALNREPTFVSDYDLWLDTVAASPESDIAQNNLAESLLEMNRVDEAIPHAQKSIALDPGFASAHNNLGWAHAQKGDLSGAVAEFQQAVALEPTLAAARNNLGAALMQTGRLDEAAAQTREALKLRPDFAKAHFNLGNVLLMQGKLDEAIREFQTTLALDPGDAKARGSLALAYFRGGHLDEAITQFRASLAINPNSANIHNDLGVAWFQKGQMEAAKAEFAEALRLKPDMSDAAKNLAKLQKLQSPTITPKSKSK